MVYMCDLGRRTFISQSALAAAALVLGACGEGREFLAGPRPLNGTIKVGDFPALANVNGAVALTLSGTPIAVVRTGAHSFVALSRVCPHEAALIVQSPPGWQCTGHGARFSLTGDWQGGQQTFDMAAYQTSYNPATDILTIG
jgi:Rieske Fe-S protein